MLDFSSSGLNLADVELDSGNFDIVPLGQFLLLSKPSWVSLSNTGYLGFRSSSGVDALATFATPTCITTGVTQVPTPRPTQLPTPVPTPVPTSQPTPQPTPLPTTPPTPAPSIGSELVCSDTYICNTNQGTSYMGCSRDSPGDDGTYSCTLSTSFGPYSTCGPCNDGDFDASTCPEDAHNCAGNSGTRMYYCAKDSASDAGVYGCYKYSDITPVSTCTCSRRRELEWYETPPQDSSAEGPTENQGLTEEATCSSGSCNNPNIVREVEALEEEPYCLAQDFPCGRGGKIQPGMVSVCQYNHVSGYHNLCIKESDSDMLEYYEHSYCGPCIGGLQAVLGNLFGLWK